MSEVVSDTLNLYNILEIGDRRIDMAFETAIILVGLTRVGKSTIFNWILKKQMIGDGEEIMPYFVNVIAHDTDQASIKDSMASHTLCPNINQYNKEKKIALIDMAGFQDKRNYIGIFGVSYFLKAVFEKVKQAKFIIAIDEENLMLSSGGGIMKTFSGFLNMFNLEQIKKNPIALKQFYQSISLCVTKSERPKDHQKYLRSICNKIKKQKNLIAEKKQEMVELIEYLLDQSNIIQEFKKARINEYPEQCTMIERFDDKLKWSYFDIQQKFIHLPFQKQFENLPADQQNQFIATIQNKIKSYLQYSLILKELITSVNSRWAEIISEWKKGTLNLKFSYKEMFEQIEEFLKGNDFYNTKQLFKQVKKIDYAQMNLVKVMKTILQLYRIIELVAELNGSFQQNMVNYSQLFVQICENLRCFCANTQEDNLIDRLKFVIERGFKQFSKLFQIKQELVSEVNRQMKDNCNGVFKQNKCTFIERFVKKLNYPILSLMFDKIQGINQYEQFFDKFEAQFKGHIDCREINFKRHRKDIDLCKANIYDKSQNKILALKCYLNVLKCMKEIRDDIKQAQDKSPDDIADELEELFMQKLRIIGFSTNILKKLPNVHDAKNYALNLCINVNNIDQACEIYQIIIEQADSNAKKIQYYNDYIEYCIKWGRLHEANVILQKKLGLEKQNFTNYKQTIEKILEVAKNIKKSTIYMDDYIKNLESLFNINEKDEYLDDYIKEIEPKIIETIK